jgi:hypothetical protein
MFKNLLTLVALFVSVSGIAVSLAREEVRCYLGLDSSECAATRPISPVTKPPVTPAPQPPQEVVKEETKPSEPIQPLETPETPPESISIPLEVIPAPEQ